MPGSYDVIYNANMIHIAPWATAIVSIGKPVLSSPRLTEKNGRIRQVIRIDRSKKYTEEFNRLGPGCSKLTTLLRFL